MTKAIQIHDLYPIDLNQKIEKNIFSFRFSDKLGNPAILNEIRSKKQMEFLLIIGALANGETGMVRLNPATIKNYFSSETDHRWFKKTIGLFEDLGILVKVIHHKHDYIFTLSAPMQAKKGYIKSYSFLYQIAFFELPIAAQRLAIHILGLASSKRRTWDGKFETPLTIDVSKFHARSNQKKEPIFGFRCHAEMMESIKSLEPFFRFSTFESDSMIQVYEIKNENQVIASPVKYQFMTDLLSAFPADPNYLTLHASAMTSLFADLANQVDIDFAIEVFEKSVANICDNIENPAAQRFVAGLSRPLDADGSSKATHLFNFEFLMNELAHQGVAMAEKIDEIESEIFDLDPELPTSMNHAFIDHFTEAELQDYLEMMRMDRDHLLDQIPRLTGAVINKYIHSFSFHDSRSISKMNAFVARFPKTYFAEIGHQWSDQLRKQSFIAANQRRSYGSATDAADFMGRMISGQLTDTEMNQINRGCNRD